MRFAGLARERSRHRHDLGSGHGLLSKQLGKTDIVADRKAEFAEGEIRDTRGMTRMVGGALAPALAILQIHVEHVDLVVVTDLRAVRPEQEAAIGNLSIRARDRRRADMEVEAELAGKSGCLANDDVVLPILQH